MAYSEDYRKRAIEYKDSGHTFGELREAFKIPPRTYYDWKQKFADGYYDRKVKRQRQAQDRQGKTQAGGGREAGRIPARTCSAVFLHGHCGVLYAGEAWDNP